MSYTTKKSAAVIPLTADVTDDLIGTEAVTGTPTVSIEPSGELTAGAVTISNNIAAADFSAGVVGDSYRVIFEFITDAVPARKYELCQTVKVY